MILKEACLLITACKDKKQHIRSIWGCEKINKGSGFVPGLCFVYPKII
jgi:hypothetical protein